MTPDLSCERCQDTLPWYVANALSNGDRAAMERHLASCGRCRAALEEWREVAATIRRADESIPPDTASLTTWAHISHQLGEQAEPAYKDKERTIMRLKDRSIPDTRTSADASPVARPRRRGHAFVELVAVAALIALSAGVFGLLAARGNSSTATSHSACAPSQATASLPAHTIPSAIAPLGTDDGWAVGGMWDSKQPTSPPAALLLHLQNCHWTPVGTPIPNAQLSDISMVTPNDGWAVGAMLTLDTTPLSDGNPRNSWAASQPLVLHYTHGSWQQVQVTADTKASAEKVKMVSANEGWMLLYHGKRVITTNGVNSVAFGYTLLHYLNGTWTNMPLGFLQPTMGVTDLDARQPGDVWLVGFYNSVGNNSGSSAFAAHYAGSVWTSYIGTAIDADADLRTVSVLSPTDVWAGGSSGLYHFDGTHWSKASIQGTVPPGAAPNIPPEINQIAMFSPTQGWALGSYFAAKGANNVPMALRYDHGVWQWTTLQIRGATTFILISGFAQSSPSQGWALGVHLLPGNDNATNEETLLLYYDAGDWGVVRQQP